jgi:hypothetical protein
VEARRIGQPLPCVRAYRRMPAPGARTASPASRNAVSQPPLAAGEARLASWPAAHPHSQAPRTATRKAREALLLPPCGCPFPRIGRAVALRRAWVQNSGRRLSRCPPGGRLTHGRSALVVWSTLLLYSGGHPGLRLGRSV